MLDFPNSPTLNQVFQTAAASYVWDGAKWEPGASTLSEAPNNGNLYGRQSLAWVQVPAVPAGSSTPPLMDGAAAAGTGTTFARADHVHPPSTAAVPYSRLPAEVQQLPIAFSFSGKPLASQNVMIPIAMAITVPADLAGSQGWANTAPASNATFNIYQSISGTLSLIGSVSFAAGSRTPVLSGSAFTLTAGQVLLCQAPATQDTSLADVGITIMASRT